jgi:cation:H+ antiporter
MPISPGDLAALGAAVVLAAAGGEAFLRAILGIAQQLRVPSAVVATTLAAFATSSPELTVSSVAALAGEPEIGLGDALGSNVANIALIFGLALLFGPIHASRADLGGNYLLALLAPVLTLIIALDGRIGRGEGAVLLVIFFLWLGWMLRIALRHRQASSDLPIPASSHGALFTLALGIFGLAALIAAGRLFVIGATGVAGAFQIDTYVIGVLVVAIGTSLPELVTVLLARWRGHDEVGIGTLIGSNLFNGLAIVGIAANIHPIMAPPSEIVVTLACGMAALLLLVPNRNESITRVRGLLLLGLYLGFIVATLAAGHHPIV